MANLQEKIARAWRLLAPALEEDLAIIQNEVARGISELTEHGDGEFYTVTRAEHCAQGRELVIVAAAGENSLPHLQAINQLARKNGFYSIRLHTKRPAGMLRMSKRAGLGYQPQETILRTVLHGEQQLK